MNHCKRFQHITAIISLSASILLAGSSPAMSQEPEEAPVPAEQQTITIEEIVVRAQKSSFALRMELENAQDVLYSTYNDFNVNDEFDVYCKDVNWTHTRVRQRLCLPVFFEEAVAEASQWGINYEEFNVVSMSELARTERRRFEELQANILRVANESPEVLDALKEMLTVEEALKRKQQQCMEEPAISFLFIKLCR